MLVMWITSAKQKDLHSKVHEYSYDINKKTGFPSISGHCIKFNHNFDWEKIKILDTELSYNKRLISEMMHKRQSQGLNK